MPVYLYLAWVVALVSTLASLFFGEVMGLPICTLCWYQRIALYPLVMLLPVAIARADRNVFLYAAPLVVTGLGFAVYHNLLYYGVIAQGLTPCTGDVPCTARQIEWLGFATIPLMSLGAFSLILICLIADNRNQRRSP